jgi:2-dehydro-3-deoxyphosphogluconate aldolase/(4S)-4-hydroxy-2-oxoglutarate aldolase
MSKFSQDEIIQRVESDGFVPLFTHIDEDVCKSVLRASYEAGIRLFEFTNRNSNSFDIFIALRKYCDQELPGMVLGIGTIKNAQHAEQYIHAGADFLISPLILEEIHEVARKHKVFWMPGCATATEIGRAENWGIGLVKIFPAKQLGGPAFVKAIKAVFRNMKFLATGGVEPTEVDLQAWFKSGINAVGIGSQLFPEEWLKAGEYASVTEHVKKIIQIISHCKNQGIIPKT